MNKLSVVIITLNEEKNIARCLASVGWADELIVVDSGSTDNTCQIAEQQFQARVFHQGWPGDGPQKRFGIAQTSNQWCLVLDADEELSPELVAHIQQVLLSPEPSSCYKIHRRSYFLGKLLRYGDWGRDWIVRLFDKSKHEYTDSIAHAKLAVRKSDATALQGYMFHHTQENMHLSVQKMNDYTTLSAVMMAERGKSSSVTQAVVHGYFAFFRSFILYLGFLDGVHGFTCAKNIAMNAYLKHLKRVFDVQDSRTDH